MSKNINTKSNLKVASNDDTLYKLANNKCKEYNKKGIECEVIYAPIIITKDGTIDIDHL